MISIIMPVYNAEKYVAEAISSVLNQTHENWELLVINDGSIDRSASIIQSYNDPRIYYFTQDNQGVSAARNVGLSHMKGDFFCFLDADDFIPNHSLEKRQLAFIKNPDLDFLDGKVEFVNPNGQPTKKVFQPSFSGYPLPSLLKLDSSCFFGPSWMIKRDTLINYSFETDLKHSEDIWFYINISNQKQYNFIEDTILYYRQSEDSAMKNLKGLEYGYRQLIQKIRSLETTNFYDILYLKIKIIKIMILSHLFDGKDWKAAMSCPFRILYA
ncbi:MAG: glycosyltransferase [Reichenbachiella sp.]